MFRPVTPLSDKDMEGADVENMDLPNAVPNFDYVPDFGLSSQVGRAAGSLNPFEGGEEEEEMMDVYPTHEAKRQKVLGWRCDDGGMDFVLPSAVPDIVPNNGHLLDRRAGSSHPRGGVKEFTPAFEEANSPTEKCENKVLKSLKKGWNKVKQPFLHNDKVETLIPSELNAHSANPNVKDGAGLASSELNNKIKPEKQRMAFFDCLRRGKVESVPTPLLKADPAIPDVREVVDPASQSKTYVGPKKQKQKASKSRKSNLQGEKVTVVPTQQPKAISDIPVGMDVPALAGPQSKPKIRPDKRMTLTQRFFGCFRRGKVESMPTSQIEADPAIPDAREVVDLADSQSKSVGLKKQKQKASKSRSFHNPWSKKGKSKVKKDANPAFPDAMDDVDLASSGGIAAANARLQTLGAIPENIGLKGGGNPDPNKAKNPGSKDVGSPEAKGCKNPRPKALKALENPRRFWGPNPGRFVIPTPKALENTRRFWDPNPARFKTRRRKFVGKPAIGWIRNPTKFKITPPKALENPRDPSPEDDKVVRPKVIDVVQEAFEPPSEKKRAKRSVLREPFDSEYQLLYQVLGEGCGGRVYKGIRISDDTPVAIKQINKQKCERTIQIPGYPKPLIPEVALLLKLGEAPSCPNVIQMYDWYETKHFYTLMLEYPLHSESLWDFVTSHRGLSENTARHLMRQAVLAVQHCLDKGVFHTDIHPGNFLVQQSTMTLKLIDFGDGHYLTHDDVCDSDDLTGAPCCTPPEIYKKFRAVPANVWALGSVLYFMVLGDYPSDLKNFQSGNLQTIEKDLSKEICDLLRWCLAPNPSDRPTLKEILDHDWFKTESDEEELLVYKMSALSTQK
nr:myosin light chain kinase 3-like [Misgurnus anguillicaudatus]